MAAQLNWRLRAMIAAGRRIPKWLPHGTAIINRGLKPLLLRQSDGPIFAETANGLRMRLNPHECVDGGLLFYPHLYDPEEIAVLARSLPAGGTFADVGANIGYYALQAARIMGSGATVVAIEADPANAALLRANVSLNGASQIRVIEEGVSDRAETLTLYRNASGNAGGHTFVPGIHLSGDAVSVRCRPLAELLAGLSRLDAMKIDIEGFELKALQPYFKAVPRAAWPKIVIAERNWRGAETLEALLVQLGYTVLTHTLYNLIARLDC